MQFTRRDFLKLSAAALGGLFLEPVFQALALEQPPHIKFGNRGIPQVALTFDDCYHLKELKKLESLLDGFPNIKVTFFAVGKALIVTAAQDPEIWQRLTAKGHEIGYHSFIHDNLWELPDELVLEDYDRWYEVLAAVLNREPSVHFARPPYGNRSLSFDKMCLARNLTVAMWSASWGGPTDKAQLAMEKVKNGDVILMHVDYQDLLNVEVAMPFLTRHDLPSVTLSQLTMGRQKQLSKVTYCKPDPTHRFPICLD